MHLPGVKIPLLALLLCGATASWGGDYLYAPRPVDGAEPGEGVLVREVTVKKGDTLSHLSKRYAGHGYYYPQILLFNEIRNPHRIQVGQVVRVPLSRKAGRKLQSNLVLQHDQGQAPAAEPSKHQMAERPKTAQQPPLRQGEKNAYSHALESFKKGDCETAIKQFDSFISRYPASVLLPEATLNRAECYLKLSTK
ncbi:LysM peptidoglycan-binding domain-containing protein [Trichlorobacter lovleyi]|uniref:LysM peptidoglycan-binding domain-containing protein n=1 Tax=Trichlorobacter lovleyi TaxID=313985 RepID=UPI00223EE599|nr:LysM peptidoglycan-binding domain-containing protein [Trichlorobacter lovleyi]QOX77804.1 LysM peptidoglycan-binding domain-containing protein [Trichlorobacter lovleyi]